jgi:ComF family protein
MSGLKIYLNKLVNLLYPRYCVHCQEAPAESEAIAPQATLAMQATLAPVENIFCVRCLTQIRRLDGPCCFICGAPFVSDAATSHSPTHRCGECRKNPPPFSMAITPFLYEGPLIAAICQFKYHKKPHLAIPLARLVVNDLAKVSVDCVMAIPLHPSRLRSREFNQSLLLARQTGHTLSLPYFIDDMIRTRETPPQVGLSRKERQENIKGSLRVTQPDKIKDQRILLVDDVYTTGATLKEGARILMQSGAKEVIVAAMARMVLA